MFWTLSLEEGADVVDHIRNRQKLLDALREELVGPAPAGEELDCSGEVSFENQKEAGYPWKQKAAGEEILVHGSPVQRYGVGVLYPAPAEENKAKASLVEEAVALEIGVGSEDADALASLSDDAARSLSKIAENISQEAEPDDFDLSLANAYRTSSMGLSFLIEVPEGCSLVVEVPSVHPRKKYPVNGRYRRKTVRIKNEEGCYIEREWWLRSPVSLLARFDAAGLRHKSATRVRPTTLKGDNLENLQLEVEVFSRPYNGNIEQRLITVCLVNRSHTGEDIPQDALSLFQAFFEVRVECADGIPRILPYPEAPPEALDDEERSLALLYRKYRSYATGHGCSADWDEPDDAGRVRWVSAECMPTVEVPGMTPDISREDGSPLKVSMKALGQLEPGDEGFAALKEVVSRYEAWINKQRKIIPSLEKDLQTTAIAHMDECKRCLDRMQQGIEYLRENKQIRFAFQLANQAILHQQICGGLTLREAQLGEDQRFEFNPPYLAPENVPIPSGRGTWRAFQIAFLLMSLKSAAEGDIPEREEVELIWFPTGGGKTEAYLGLSAFVMFLRRLRNPQDAGVCVLMRYTLRLLTAQQFQRAAGLITAMEYLRRKHQARLGEKAFSIGIWLGESTTPNSRSSAMDLLRGLRRGTYGVRNKFLLTRCPWCGARLGPVVEKKKKSRGEVMVLGYKQTGDTVQFHCPDRLCVFSRELPVYVVDEDIYEHCPTLIIGTADKFAMLAWEPKARSLFGLDMSGNRVASPPGLIIQDELHLIAGPLGSMVGLYEVLIEELCTDRRGEKPIRPKIVCSTATIRRYKEQIKALYARDKVTLFPPPGLEVADSFFARHDTDEAGKLRPGRLYAGVNAPGLGSLQTAQVRTFSALLQAPMSMSDEERDPWWTSLIFFNSLRELGGALSLFQSDIPDYMGTLINRQRKTLREARRIDNVIELTSRLDSEQVPKVLEELGVKSSSKNPRPVDICLASSIIEVGIDVDRLSLMAIVGQPKSTSQYIQVSGRVGRRLIINQENPEKNDFRPGLVVILYGASKPRDRSHFERFRSYHQRLYAQVEPTSATPFSPPALERALHAVMSAYVRQMGSKDLADCPAPFPENLLRQLKEIVLERAKKVDPDELEEVRRVYEKREREWQSAVSGLATGLKWKANPRRNVDPPLLHAAGAYMPENWRQISWPTPQSMRNVDCECRLQIASVRRAED